MVEDHGRQGSLQVNVYLQMVPSSDSGITKTELALALQLIDDAVFDEHEKGADRRMNSGAFSKLFFDCPPQNPLALHAGGRTATFAPV
jgi:hypothetical protein